MTLAIDGAVSGLNGSYPPTTFNLVTTQDNDVLIVTAGSFDSGGYKTVTGITSNPALTWTLRKRVQYIHGSAYQNFEEWYAVWTSHGTISITVAVSGAPNVQGWTGIAFGISGADTTTIFDSNAGANPSAGGDGTSNPSVNITTSNAHDMIVGLLYKYNVGTPTVGSGFTLIVSCVNNLEHGEYKVVTATQSATAVNWTIVTTNWNLIADAIMEYVAPTAPTVTTEAVSSVEETTATGNGTITATGGANCTKRGICWNTTGTPTISDSKTEESPGPFGTGAFTESMTSLAPGTLYYVRAYAYNSVGYGYGNEVTFYTKPNDPSSLGCTIIDSHQINLAWTKGTGGDKTKIIRKIGSYPANISDGDLVYFDIGTSYNNIGLIGGVHYYYRAWAYDSDSGYYSDGYSENNATTTTPTLSTGKIFVVDRENNVFRIDLSTLIEEKILTIT
jgi:hypothetical protein